GTGPLGDQGTNFTGDRGLVALAASDARVHARRRHQGVALGVVDDLGHDVPQRAGDDQAGTFRGPTDALTNAEVSTGPGGGALGGAATTLNQRGRHFLPAFLRA